MDNLLHIIVINKSIQENKVAYLKTLLKQNAKIGLFTPESREKIREATTTIQIHLEPVFIEVATHLDLSSNEESAYGQTTLETIFSHPQIKEVDVIIIVANSIFIPHMMNFLHNVKEIIPKLVAIREGELAYVDVQQKHFMKL